MQRSDEQASSTDDDLAALETSAFDDSAAEEVTDRDTTSDRHTTAPTGDTKSVTSTGDSPGLRDRFNHVFSPRAFLAALLLSTGGLVAGQSIPILGQLPLVGQFIGFLGVFLAGFVLGLVAKHRRYLEGALGGALAAGLAFVANAVLFTFVSDVGLQFAAVGAGVGAVAALLGVYFGRDLRDGLQRDVP